MFRSYTAETTQFLAPYDMSMKNSSTTAVQEPAAINVFTSEQNVNINTSHSIQSTQQDVITRDTTTSNVNSISSTNISNSIENVGSSLLTWNPFEDPTPFSQMTEDHIFDAEFDKIRSRGSDASKLKFFFNDF